MSELTHPAPIKSNMSYMSSKLASYYSNRTWFLLLSLQKVRKTKISLPQCNFIKIHLDLMNIVSQKLIIFDILNIFKLKNHHFLAKWPKCCPKFDFVFREIAKFSSKFRFHVSQFWGKFCEIWGKFCETRNWKFRQITQNRKFSQPPYYGRVGLQK